jgi:hypothetical protein
MLILLIVIPWNTLEIFIQQISTLLEKTPFSTDHYKLELLQRKGGFFQSVFWELNCFTGLSA